MASLVEILADCCDQLYQIFTPFEGGDAIRDSLHSFLRSRNPASARDVYTAFLEVYRMPGLDPLLKSMEGYEVRTARLLPRHRDHYVHSVDVFLLGIALYISNNNIRKIVDQSIKYPDAYDSSEEFLYRWGLTALFHDMGYPLELCMELINCYSAEIIAPNLYIENGMVKYNPIEGSSSKPIVLSIHDRESLTHLNILHPLPQFEIDYHKKYPELRDLKLIDAFQAIAWNLSCRLGFMTQEGYLQQITQGFERGLSSGRVDHAIISSAVFLRWINQFYSVSDWNPAYFFYPAIDAASAIYLHNSLGYLYAHPPLLHPKLYLQQHAMAYMLYFCDHMQECDRITYLGDETRIEYEMINLEIDDDTFHLGLKPGSGITEEVARRLPGKIRNEIDNVLHRNKVFSTLSITIE